MQIDQGSNTQNKLNTPTEKIPTSLSERMKQYESVPRTYLEHGVPVILRVDGRAFHTFTAHMERPFDQRFRTCMTEAALHLCKEVCGAKLGYVQSDEITILVTDWDEPNTQAWFGYGIQKLCSVVASECTVAFHNACLKNFPPEILKRLPSFDARAWNLPESEVTNMFIWRQQDAIRNSILMVGCAYFSQKQLQHKSTTEVREMLLKEKGIEYETFPISLQRGVCIRRNASEKPLCDILEPSLLKKLLTEGKIQDPNEIHITKTWEVDKEIPIFTQDRMYVEGVIPPHEVLSLPPRPTIP